MSEKTKKVSYANLLKEALSDFTEVPKNVDTVGPFLDPILSYKGDGELPTHKDAASILERYYFEQDQDEGVTVSLDEEESVVNKDIVTVGKDKAALADEPEAVKKSKDDTEDAMAMEAEEVTEQAEEEVVADEEEAEEVAEQIVPEEPAGLSGDEKELPPRKGKDAENQVKAAQLEADDSVESAVIEKLISEMEEEDEEEQGGDEESVEGPVAEQDEGEEEEKEEEKELDVDEEMEGGEEKEEEEAVEEQAEVEEQAAPSAVPGGPTPDKKMGEDKDEGEMYEAFQIFKEQIEDEEVPEVDSEEVVV